MKCLFYVILVVSIFKYSFLWTIFVANFDETFNVRLTYIRCEFLGKWTKRFEIDIIFLDILSARQVFSS